MIVATKLISLLCATVVVVVVVVVSATDLVKPRVGDNWGVNIHFLREAVPGEVAMIAKGFRVARMGIQWFDIEQHCGQYNFTAFDGLLSTMKTHGIRPYWILGKANPWCYGGGGHRSPCDNEACVEAYGKYAAAVAEHYQGEDIIFETPNEPNQAEQSNITASLLARMANAAGPHFASRGEVLVGPAFANAGRAQGLAYLRNTIAAGFLNNASLSGLSGHMYSQDAPESRIASFAALRALLDQSGAPELPMVNGEWGYSTCTRRDTENSRSLDVGNKPQSCWKGFTEEQQGKYLPRMWLVALMSNASVSITYDWKDDKNLPHVRNDNFGSVHFEPTGNASQPYAPKPEYHAAVAAQSTVGNSVGYRGLANISTVPSAAANDNTYAMQFERPPSDPPARASFMYAVWTAAKQQGDPDRSVNVTLRPEVCSRSQEQQQDNISTSTCWDTVSYLGDRTGGQLCCANDGTVTVSATAGVTYLV